MAKKSNTVDQNSSSVL